MTPKATHPTVFSIFRLVLPVVLLFPTYGLMGQDPEEEEVFEMSPFLVEGSDNSGWTPTQTLAGSRLRTNVSDVASQMDILTMDFMDDYGLTSVEEAAIYSINVENDSEYVSTGFGEVDNDTNLRVRGLSNARRTREFFAVYTRSDNYNLERVTLASGPNPMMFGIGAPSGAVDLTLAKAFLNEDFAEVKFRVDSWDGIRGEYQMNKVLIEDKLALRVALLADNKKFDEEPSIEKDRRLYGNLVYKPFSKTRISLHFERVSTETRRPGRNVPYEELTGWYRAGDLGSVYWNEYLFPNDASWVAGGRSFEDSRVFRSLDNTVVAIAGYDPAGIGTLATFPLVEVESLSTEDWGLIDPVNKDPGGISLTSDEYYPRDLNTRYNLSFTEWDASIFNAFLNQEILPNLNFEAAYQWESGDEFDGDYMFNAQAQTIRVDPNRFLPNGEPNPYSRLLYFDGEPAFQISDFERSEWRVSLSYEFDFRDHVDNGMLSWLGRHRLAGVLSGIEEEDMSQEYGYRYQPVVENGRMRDPYFEGYSYGDPDSFGRLAMGALGSGYSAADNGRRFLIRSYVGEDIGLLPSNGGYQLGQPIEVTDSNGEVWVLDAVNAGVGTNGEQLITGRNTNGNKSTFDTQLFSYQAYLFQDRIILTYGYREDTANTADELAPEVLWENPETGEVVPAGSAGYQAHKRLYGYQPLLSESEQSGETELKGIVVHPFRNWSWRLPLGADISLHYNEADTFAPNISALSPDGSFYPGEQGDGTDKGFRLSLFDGKFNMRYNEYEVSAGPTDLGLPFRRLRAQLRPAMRDVLQALVADEQEFREKFPVWPLEDRPGAVADKLYPFDSGAGFEAMNFFNFIDPYGIVAESRATGTEITVSWQPTPNLDIRFTWNDQEVVQTEIARDWRDFITEFERIMDTTTFTEGYIPGDSQEIFHNPNGYDMDGNGVIEQFTWADIPDGDGPGRVNPTRVGDLNTPWGQNDDNVEGGWARLTMKERWNLGIYEQAAGLPVMLAYDGRANEFSRSNRWNLNVMYRFTEGRLKGWRAGGAYRWRSAPAIGFGVQEVNGVQVPDTSIIQYGKEETMVDLTLGYYGRAKWLGNRRYGFTLNVRNAFPSDDYVVKHRDYFTGDSISQIRVDGRQFILSFEMDL
jgi:hypothetical protein